MPLHIFLHDIGMLDYYTSVFEQLPDLLEASTWKQIVVNILHDLGIKEFQ